MEITGQVQHMLSLIRFKSPVFKPKYLNIRDLTYERMKNYVISPKMNGGRKYLYFDNVGQMYLVNSQNVVKLKSRSKVRNIILDCQKRDDDDTKPLWIMDVLYSDKNIMNLSLMDRMKILETILINQNILDLKEDGISVGIISYHDWTNPHKFFDIISGILRETPKDDHHGILFTSKGPVQDNSLKWKYPEQNSIDFLIMNGGRLGVMTKDGIRQYKDFKYNPKQINVFAEDLMKKWPDKKQLSNVLMNPPNIDEGEVWSFEKHGIWIPIYRRDEKTHNQTPNFIDVADEIIDILRFPILESTITGKDYVLLEAYHSKLLKNIEYINTDNFQKDYRIITSRPSEVSNESERFITYFGIGNSNIDRLDNNSQDFSYKYMLKHPDNILDIDVPKDYIILTDHNLESPHPTLLSNVQSDLNKLFSVLIMTKPLDAEIQYFQRIIIHPYIGIIGFNIVKLGTQDESLIKSILYLDGLRGNQIEERFKDDLELVFTLDKGMTPESVSEYYDIDLFIIQDNSILWYGHEKVHRRSILLVLLNSYYPCAGIDNVHDEYFRILSSISGKVSRR